MDTSVRVLPWLLRRSELKYLKGLGIIENRFAPQNIPSDFWGLPSGLNALWL